MNFDLERHPSPIIVDYETLSLADGVAVKAPGMPMPNSRQNIIF